MRRILKRRIIQAIASILAGVAANILCRVLGAPDLYVGLGIGWAVTTTSCGIERFFDAYDRACQWAKVAEAADRALAILEQCKKSAPGAREV